MVGPSTRGSPFGSIFDGLQNFGVIRYPPNNLRSPKIWCENQTKNPIELVRHCTFVCDFQSNLNCMGFVVDGGIVMVW